MRSFTVALIAAAIANAQYVPPPSPVLLTTTKSAVLPVLPTNFNGVDTLQGAIISKAPVNVSYTPVNGPATVQSNNPSATYVATLPSVAFNELVGTVISGTVMGSAGPGGVGVQITINLSGLPSQSMYGPFPYHIHNMMVPADGNCTSTLGHFDPTNAGEYYTCNTNATQNCQVGDLAGKHGKIMTDSTFTASYVDMYLSTDPNSPDFFGAKSIVIHTKNTTRITCANFMQMGMGASSSGSSTATGSAPVSTYTGAAVKTAVGSAFAGVAGLLGMLML